MKKETKSKEISKQAIWGKTPQGKASLSAYRKTEKFRVYHKNYMKVYRRNKVGI